MKFKTGDVVFFFYEDTFQARVVQYFNLIKYKNSGPTHVGIISKVKKDKVEIYEALGSGFVKNDYEKEWLENMITDWQIDVRRPKITLKKVKKICEKYEGKPYAWCDIISIGLSLIFRFKLNGLTGAKKVICSEAVARVLYDCSNKKINMAQEYEKSYDTLTPFELYYSLYLKS